jgi:glycosyltransferase involved in cell wall biosynthesis
MRLGFIQPAKIPKLMQRARCLVLPSLWEPWGVVIQEAAAAGLPVIATHSCGASVAFLRDGINGYIIAPRVRNLTEAMFRLSMSPEQELTEMSHKSAVLARLWDPKKQAKYFCETIKTRIQTKY